MDRTTWTIACLLILVLCVCYLQHVCVDHFKSKREKAEFVQKNMYPEFYSGTESYGKYKNLVGDTDAVEYHDVKQAYRDNKFTTEQLTKVV